MTVIWTRSGWAFPAVLIDRYTRRITGWAVSEHCDTELALQALSNAVTRHRPAPGLIHPTDRGSTYTATDYRDALKDFEKVTSMSRGMGNCWDPTVAESTIGTIKTHGLRKLSSKSGEAPFNRGNCGR
jgi:putative transposase